MSEQGSAEWHAERLGKVTASRIADMTARTKSGWGASRDNYRSALIAERLTGVPTEYYVNAAMAHGSALEPEARDLYSLLANVDVEECGFVVHPRIAMSGASPDGLVGDDGLVEIKCPELKTHIDTLIRGKVSERYVLQMQWQMACTGRQWCDFASYCPSLPGEMRLFVARVERDDERIAAMEELVVAFLAEVDATVAALGKRYGVKVAA